MTIKIAVCDDNIQALNQLEVYLAQIQKESNLKFKTFFFSSAEELLETMPRDVDVVLLDIQMKQATGIDAARKLREEGLNFFLIFITSHVQYALEGYEVHAYAFLQKPLRYAPFKMYLLEIAQKLEQARPFVLTLKNGSDVELIDCSKIVYIEVYGHKTSFIFDNDKKEFAVSMNELEEQLKRQGFFRAHKSYLINMRKVSSFGQSDLTMANGDIVPLSRHRRQDFLIALNSVIGG